MQKQIRPLEELTTRESALSYFLSLFKKVESEEAKRIFVRDNPAIATATLEEEVGGIKMPTNNLLSVANFFESIPTDLYCTILYTDNRGSCLFYFVPFKKLSRSQYIALSFMTLLDLFKEQYDAVARGDNYIISDKTIGVLSTRKSEELIRVLKEANVWVHINKQQPERDLNQLGREIITPIVKHLRSGSSEVYDKERRVVASHDDPIMALFRGVDALCQEYLTYLKLRFYLELDNFKIPPQVSLREYKRF